MLIAAPRIHDADFFGELRAREFSRLDTLGETYLDYAGSALYGISQLRAHHALLECSVFGNPHSTHAASEASSHVIETARARVLEFFDVDTQTHDVCFTANTTAAIKLVAESYPFGPQAPLLLSADNHNSVNGMREYARRTGARVRYLPLDSTLRLIDPECVLAEESTNGGGLLAFPAQSNFSGVLHPAATLVAKAKSLGFDVLLDVADFVSGHALSLRACPADFAVLSFYKMFGFPTGVGALVARREALAKLRRPWFAGGTVDYVSVALEAHQLRPSHEGFEDGTASFLAIAALESGFKMLAEVGMTRLNAHIDRLTARFIVGVQALQHRNGEALAKIYGPGEMAQRGGAVAFNLRDAAGKPISYSVVEDRALTARVAVRGGCFCNPGAAEAAFAFDADRTRRCLERLGSDFSVPTFRECMGVEVGAVRLSPGLANNEADVDRALAVVASFLE
ncbi:MAG: aminotransferase class V-fold PLP-dependent enzyme [Vicinamibacteria bacterium]